METESLSANHEGNPGSPLNKSAWEMVTTLSVTMQIIRESSELQFEMRKVHTYLEKNNMTQSLLSSE
jgi:hypothetical protein